MPKILVSLSSLVNGMENRKLITIFKLMDANAYLLLTKTFMMENENYPKQVVKKYLRNENYNIPELSSALYTF